jgi:hypothetical protein
MIDQMCGLWAVMSGGHTSALLPTIDFASSPFLGNHSHLPSTLSITELVSEYTNSNSEDGSSILLINVGIRQYDYTVSTQKTTS